MNTVILVLLIIVVIILIGISIIYAFTLALGLLYVPYIPVTHATALRVWELIQIQKGMRIYDLGCGDGRVLMHACRTCPDIQATGYEISWYPYIKAKMRARKYAHQKSMHIYMKNFFKADISDADIVFCYLFPRIVKKLEHKFQKELKKGCIIVSCGFPLFQMQPDKIDKKHSTLYIYTVK